MFKNMYKKPKSVREMYAFWYAAGITGVIAVVWVISLQYRFDNTSVSPENLAERAPVGAFSQFINETKNSFTAVFTSTPATSTDEGFDEQAESAETHGVENNSESANSPDNARTGFFLEPRTAGPAEFNRSSSEEREIRIETVSQQAFSTSSEGQ